MLIEQIYTDLHKLDPKLRKQAVWRIGLETRKSLYEEMSTKNIPVGQWFDTLVGLPVVADSDPYRFELDGRPQRPARKPKRRPA